MVIERTSTQTDRLEDLHSKLNLGALDILTTNPERKKIINDTGPKMNKLIDKQKYRHNHKHKHKHKYKHNHRHKHKHKYKLKKKRNMEKEKYWLMINTTPC
ncbi:hypothetical protein F4703DRAFT_1794548 [Phycomyces blakesleeanus]